MIEPRPGRVWRRKVLVARPGEEWVAYENADRFPYWPGEVLATKEQAGSLPLEIETEEYADPAKQRMFEAFVENEQRKTSPRYAVEQLEDEFEKLWPSFKASMDEDRQRSKAGAD